MNISSEHFSDAIEAILQLHCEWNWKKDEPRCGYQKEYERLGKLLSEMESEFQAQLPTLEDVQKAFREASGK
jgi:hypothetical protein